MKDLTDMRCGNGVFSTSKADPMYPACATHDLDYVLGGDDAARNEADWNFEKNCEFIANEKKTFISRLECWLYPKIARLFGKYIWIEDSREEEYLRQGREHEKD